MSSANSPASNAILIEVIGKHIREKVLTSAAGDVGDDTALVSGGLMNSLSTLELVSFLEDTFDVDFAAHEIRVENFDTVARIAEVVEEKQSA